MSRVFSTVPLRNSKEDVCHPPSLPLVLPSNCSFDLETQQLTENKGVSSDAGMNYKLVPETVELLENITKPVAVLSICGPYRSGKSYFLSRMLGRKETFKLGHTMEACTRGIWMASSVLECDEFVLLLLDTEGIDAADKSNAGVANLLVLTMLLSSTFVYNSKSVPRGRDLKKMSYFASLSKLMEGNTPSQVLPEFVWLLRDVDCVPTSADGNELSPTDYLTSVLQKNKSCSTSSTLLQHFPTFRCFTIPPPSADGDILADIFANLEKLTPFFNKEVNGTIQWLLDNVRAKVVGSSGIECDGKMLACLLEQYFAQIRKHSDEIPNFQVSWLKAIEFRLMKLADSLVSEYDRDMQAALDGKLPMVEGTNGEAGETLMNIHLHVYAKKRLQYQKELLPFNFLEGTDLLSYLDKNIAEYMTEGGHDKIIGGRLFNFVQVNIKSSERYCATVYHEEYNKIVRPTIENALTAGIPTTFDEELSKFVDNYYKFARGPAIDYMFEELRTESIGFEAQLSQIPGPVQSLRVVGASSDRVKLRWNCPEVNAAAATKYVVMIKSKGKDWDEVGIRNRCSALVTDLQGSTWYCFMVLAKSKKYTGRQALIVKVKTGISETTHKALRTTAMVASPIALPCMSVYLAYKEISKGIRCKSGSWLASGLLQLITLPATSLVGIIPGLGQYLSFIAHDIATEMNKDGSDTHSTDTEVLQWKCKTESAQSDVSQANSQSETPQCSAGDNTSPKRPATMTEDESEVSAYSECLDDNVNLDEATYISNTDNLYESGDETD